MNSSCPHGTSIDGSKPPRPSLVPTVRATARYSAASIQDQEWNEREERNKRTANKNLSYCRGSAGSLTEGEKNRFLGGVWSPPTREIGANLSCSGDRSSDWVAARGVRATNQVRRGGEWGLLGDDDDASVSLATTAGRVTGINGRMERGPLLIPLIT